MSRIEQVQAGLRQAVHERLYRAPKFRRFAEPVITRSVVRRLAPPVLLRGYDDFNRGAGVPRKNFTPDFRLNQAAELLGTVGTFHGPGALEMVIGELHEAFENVRFEPRTARWLDEEQLLVVVRFQAKGRGSGVEVDQDIAHVWTHQGLFVKSLDVYWEPREALEAAGLADQPN